MTVTDKTQEALRFIQEQLRVYSHPVLFWSGGKDSMVLLHLMYSNSIHMPVVYYMDPFFPRKNRFAQLIIESYLLECHNYPPLRVSLKTAPNMVALVSEYSTGPASVASVLKNSIEFKDGDDEREFLCGVRFLMRPCATFAFPWDVAFVAHKDCDEDPIYGLVPLHSNIVYRDEGPDFLFPLKDWSHDAIWDYTAQHDVPIQTDRYDVANRREWPDKKFNSDWFPVCIRCVDKRNAGATVYCPKMQRDILNVSGAAAEFGWVPDYFGELKK